MQQSIKALLVAVALATGTGAGAKDSPQQSFERGLELIHAFSGAGDELERAAEIAASLAASHPDKGYGQALMAELLSTWRLNQDGTPPHMYEQVLALANQALQLNPQLAQAHVARARAMLRASKYADANKAIGSALDIDPNLVGAMFLRAEVMRRTGQEAEAETWYLKFIKATSSRTRQSNAYYWLGKMHRDSAWRQPNRWPVLIPKARAAYQMMIDLDPDGAWKNVNFAILLNHEVGDFDAAERYALRALKAMEFRMARNHLALARYQKLASTMGVMDQKELLAALDAVHASTGVSFDDAAKFAESYVGIRGRLGKIRSRLVRGAR